MKILGLDCATEACSVALYVQNPGAATGEVVSEQHRLTAREHTKHVLPMVAQVLEEAGLSLALLDAIAYGRGPGSFTGLRVALGAVQGLAYGANLPLVPVSTLAGLAQTWLDTRSSSAEADTIVAALDARMGELYWAAYGVDQGLVTALGPEYLEKPDSLSLAQILPVSGPVIAVGSGWHYRASMPPEQSGWPADTELLPRAGSLARLAARLFASGDSVAPGEALPVYLRDEVAWQKTGQQSG